MKRLFIILFLLLLHDSVFASLGGSRANAAEDYEESWMITFGAGFTTRLIGHQETSGDAGFATLAEQARLSDIRVALGVGKEFLQQQTISFTLGIFAGVTSGSFSSGEENQTQFEESLKSNHFGGSLSVNYNIYFWGYKLQPFLGVEIIQESGEITTSYDNSGNTTVLTHEFEDQVAMPGLGVRVFDDEVSLMSYFKFSMPQYLSDSAEASAIINGADVTVTTTSTFERAPFAFEMGFGYFF